MLGGADNPNGELLSYITGADTPHLLRDQDLLCNLEVHRSCNNSTLLRDVDS